MFKSLSMLFQRVKIVVFSKDNKTITFEYRGPKAWDKLTEKRNELDVDNIRYKVYERYHFKWYRRHTIQDLLVEDD